MCPREGVCVGAKFFGSTLLLLARSVCVSLSAFFISSYILVIAEYELYISVSADLG